MAALAALAGSAGVASVGLFYYLLLATLLRDRGKSDDLFLPPDYHDSLLEMQLNDDMDLKWIMQRKGNEWRLKDGRDYATLLTCDALWRQRADLRGRLLEPVGAGWSKSVYRAQIARRPYAVKLVNRQGHAFNQCLSQPGNTYALCHHAAVSKFLKELRLMRQLQTDDNVLKLRGYCVPLNAFDETNLEQLAIVTDVGEPLDVLKLVRMSWTDRLQLIKSITRLLQRLYPLTLLDLRRQQFVLVDNQPVLVDLDDVVETDEPNCSRDADCFGSDGHRNGLRSVAPTVGSVKCTRGKCEGSTELATVRRLYDAFIADFLSYGASDSILPLLDNLKSTILNGNATFVSILRQFDHFSSIENDRKLEHNTLSVQNNKTILLHNYNNENQSGRTVPIENIVNNTGRVLSNNTSFLDCVSKNLLICDT